MTSKRDRERWLQTEIGGSTSLSLSLSCLYRVEVGVFS